MARTATSQAPVLASSIRRAIVVYSMGAKPTPASAASARPSMNAVPESSPVSRFLLAMTGLPVKRAAWSSPRGANSALMDGLGAVSRPAQPATSATPTMPAMTRAALISRPLRLEDVDADDHHLARALVLRPVRHVTRFRDDITGVVLLLEAALAHLGERSLQDVRERRAVLVAVNPGHGSGLERQAPETELMSRQIRREIHRADDLPVHALGVLRRAHPPHPRPPARAHPQRGKPGPATKRARGPPVRSLPPAWG